MITMKNEGLKMPKYEPQYTEDDFLRLFEHPRMFYSVGYIAKAIGCDRRTARTYLAALEAKSRIKSYAVDNGKSYVWELAREIEKEITVQYKAVRSYMASPVDIPDKTLIQLVSIRTDAGNIIAAAYTKDGYIGDARIPVGVWDGLNITEYTLDAEK